MNAVDAADAAGPDAVDDGGDAAAAADAGVAREDRDCC